MSASVSALLREGVILCVVGSAALGAVGCGGGDSATGPSPTPAPTAAPAPAPSPAPAPVTNVIFSGGDVIPSKFIVYYPFTTTATGTIGVTVDWTLAANDLDLYLARGTNPCSLEQFNNRQCTFLGSATSTTSKPEQFSVPNLGAGPYTLYVGNFGNTQDSLSFQITLASLPGATAASRTSTGAIKSALSGMTIIR